MTKEYKGYNRILIIEDNAVVIKSGIRGVLLGGGMLRGDKTIPYSSIVAVQLKKAGLTQGYLQLTLKGGSEAKGGLFQSFSDENTINFMGWGDDNKNFEEAKKTIESRLGGDGKTTTNKYDEVAKIAGLRDKGILSEEEFSKEKDKLLG